MTAATKYSGKRPSISEALNTIDDYGMRLEQIHCLAEALSSMVGYDAKKEVICLVEMICEKSDV